MKTNDTGNCPIRHRLLPFMLTVSLAAIQIMLGVMSFIAEVKFCGSIEGNRSVICLESLYPNWEHYFMSSDNKMQYAGNELKEKTI